MNSYSFAIKLDPSYISIGPVQLVVRNSHVENLTNALGIPDRILTLSHNNTVYIYDQIGIRFWAEQDVVSSLQFVLETDKYEVLPLRAFVGPISYQELVLFPPVSANKLIDGELANFVQDTDPLQYGMIVYEATASQVKYTAIVSRTTGNIESISVS